MPTLYLHGSDDPPPGGLEDVLVDPVRMLGLDDGGLDVVPTVEDDAQGEQGRVLVDAGVAKH